MAHPKVAALRFEGDYEVAKFIVDALNRERGFREYRLVAAREGAVERAPSEAGSDTNGKDSSMGNERCQSDIESPMTERERRWIELQIEKERSKHLELQLKMAMHEKLMTQEIIKQETIKAKMAQLRRVP